MRQSRHHRQHQRSHAGDRQGSGRRANLRLLRSVSLGAVAVVLAIYWLGDQYGISPEETLEFMFTAGLFVGLLVVAGLIGFAGLLLLRKLIAGREKNDHL